MVIVTMVVMIVIVVRMDYICIVSSEPFYGAMVMVPIRPLSARRISSAISVARIVASIDMTTEMIMTVVPGANSDKRAIRKPFWPVVSIRSTLIGRVVIVAIWARRFWSKLHTKTNLSARFSRKAQKAKRHNCRSCKIP